MTRRAGILPIYFSTFCSSVAEQVFPLKADCFRCLCFPPVPEFIPFPPDSIEGILHVLVGVCVLTGFSITTASFAIYEVTEHHSGSKRLQHIAGISEAFYWAVNFFYDMVKIATSEWRKV